MIKKDYTFQIARLRAIETKLLNSGQVERMISAKSPNDAFKILHDSTWAEYIKESYTAENFGQVLDDGLNDVKTLIVNMIENERDFNFVWIFYDLDNAKILTKAKLAGIDPDNIRHMLSRLGTITRSEMRKVVFEKKKIQQSLIEEIVDGKRQITPLENLCETISEIEEKYKETGDPEVVDNILNTTIIPIAFDKAKKTKSYVIKSFFGRMIDIENIKSFLRRGHSINEQEKIDFEESLIPCGKIGINFLKQAKTIKDILLHTKFLSVYETVRDHISEDHLDFIEIEKRFDEVLFETLKPSKIEPFGPEAIFAFFWTKRRNAEIIRAIMTGKLNGVDEKTIRKWVKIPSLPLV